MRFKIGERVYIYDKRCMGVIIDRNIAYKEKDGKPFIDISYMVKPEGAKSFSDYLVCNRKEIQKEQKECLPDPREDWTTADLGEGFSVVVYSYVFDGPRYTAIDTGRYSTCSVDPSVKKMLKISYAICSKDDEFSINEGLKICRSRIEKNPMCSMFSEFDGDFDKKTVSAILKAKTEYITAHRNRFVNKRGKHHVFRD